jgi:hypothetical protein
MNASWLRTIILTALLFCGCSRFESEWRRAVSGPISTNSIAGPWEGRWLSTVNGHTDKLRAIITEAHEGDYDVKFRAAYKKGITFHFGYTVRMEVASSNGVIAFHGAEDLGMFAGGIYTYVGHATPTNFFSTYDSKYDRGIFEMKRPAVGRIPVYSATDGR